MLILGLFLHGTGIEVPTGQNVTETSNGYVAQDTYDSVDTLAVSMIAWIALLGGFYALLQTIGVLFHEEEDDSPRFEEFE